MRKEEGSLILEAIMKYIIEMFKKLKSTFVNTKFIQFCLFGLVNTFNTAIFSQIFVWFDVAENLSAIIGYILSLQIAFLLTSKYIFRAKPTIGKYYRFLLSYLPSFLVYVMLHAIISENVDTTFVATLISVLLSGPITFAIVKIYAFERKENKKGKE